MKYENYLLYAVLVIVVAVFAYGITGFNYDNGVRVQDSVDSTDSQAYKTVSTGTTGQGDVSIDLTPQGVVDGKLEVKIAVNTHSVSLDGFDLKQITTLEYDGKSVNPVSAISLRGHHSNGELVFEVEGEPSSFTIKIKGIPAVEERVFEW